MTDEDTFVLPDALRRARHPRRDRPDVARPPALDKGAADRARSLVADVRENLDVVLGLPGTAPEIAEAARAHLRGEPDPLGAATVAFAAAQLNSLPSYTLRDPDRVFVDAWVTEHGLAFAVRAFAEWAGIWMDPEGFKMRGRFSPEGLRSMAVGRRPADEMRTAWWLERKSARSLRARLAAAPDDVYAEAVAGLEGARRHDLQGLITAYLAPTRDDWADAALARYRDGAWPDQRAWWMPFCVPGRPDQVAALGTDLRYSRELDVVASLIDGVGPAAVVAPIVDAADHGFAGDDDVRRLQGVLAALPLDEAFRALVERIDDYGHPGRAKRPGALPAVLTAAHRFPDRAMRLLPGAEAPRAAQVLAAHVRAHPDLAAKVAPDLPAGQRAAIRTVLDETRLPQAANMPPLLAEPPWTRPGAKAGPVVLKDLPLPGARAVSWAPGEREAWTARLPANWRRGAEEMQDPDAAAKVVAGTSSRAWGEVLLLLGGPEDLARPLLKGWEPDRLWEADEWLPTLVARFELDACDLLLSAARRDPARFGEWALPLLTDEVARLMADWLVRLKTTGRTARAWFRRHGSAAAPSLVPDALGKAGPGRRAAEAALRMIAERDGTEPVVEAARVHGEKAAAAIEALLTRDPLDDLPGKIPSFDWVNPHFLPQILMRDGAEALPDDAAGHVLTMLAMSKPDDPYPGVAAVRELCDPASLAEFGWALFRWWETCSAPAAENWALTQLALTGDDDTVRRFTPVIRAWPGQDGHAKAVTGLDVLAAMGTETALMNLHGISQRVKFKALKTKAQEKIGELAAELELTAEQVADRLVPDFGLDASGTLTLDYGPRRFVIGFDELLRPTVTDEDGTPRKSFPKPGAKDHPVSAPDAYKRFADLKKDVRTVASDQIARLEQAMLTRRRWPVREFREFLADHPLVGHLVRRLIWRTDDTAFRVAEDGTFADVADEAVTVPDDAQVGVAHPVDLGDDLPAWTALLADYEILQPFEQLGRPVHTLTEDEREGGRLARFEGAKADVADLLALARARGWERGAPAEVGLEHWISRPLPGGHHLVLSLDPGFPVYDPSEEGEQTLVDVRLAHYPHHYDKSDPEPGVRFGDLGLDPVTVSEVLADLVRLAAPSQGTNR